MTIYNVYSHENDRKTIKSETCVQTFEYYKQSVCEKLRRAVNLKDFLLMLIPLTGSKRGRSPCPPAGSSSSSSFSCPSSWSPPPCWETRCPAVRPAPDPRSAWPAGAPAPGDTTGSSECKCSSPQSERDKRGKVWAARFLKSPWQKKEGRRRGSKSQTTAAAASERPAPGAALQIN